MDVISHLPRSERRKVQAMARKTYGILRGLPDVEAARDVAEKIGVAPTTASGFPFASYEDFEAAFANASLSSALRKVAN